MMSRRGSTAVLSSLGFMSSCAKAGHGCAKVLLCRVFYLYVV